MSVIQHAPGDRILNPSGSTCLHHHIAATQERTANDVPRETPTSVPWPTHGGLRLARASAE